MVEVYPRGSAELLVESLTTDLSLDSGFRLFFLRNVGVIVIVIEEILLLGG